jgi:hypothetical protein
MLSAQGWPQITILYLFHLLSSWDYICVPPHLACSLWDKVLLTFFAPIGIKHPISASQVAGITAVSHYALPSLHISFKVRELFKFPITQNETKEPIRNQWKMIHIVKMIASAVKYL